MTKVQCVCNAEFLVPDAWTIFACGACGMRWLRYTNHRWGNTYFRRFGVGERTNDSSVNRGENGYTSEVGTVG